jgi:glutathione peroxidase
VINVASKCGLTSSNYKFLQEIYSKHAIRGLEILAFPCNQFGKQEPGTNAEIKAYATQKKNATYRLFSKTDVNGPDADEVFKFLRYNSELFDAEEGVLGHIQWNFGKFLVDAATGKEVEYFSSRGDLKDVEDAIAKRLK